MREWISYFKKMMKLLNLILKNLLFIMIHQLLGLDLEHLKLSWKNQQVLREEV